MLRDRADDERMPTHDTDRSPGWPGLRYGSFPRYRQLSANTLVALSGDPNPLRSFEHEEIASVSEVTAGEPTVDQL